MWAFYSLTDVTALAHDLELLKMLSVLLNMIQALSVYTQLSSIN